MQWLNKNWIGVLGFFCILMLLGTIVFVGEREKAAEQAACEKQPASQVQLEKELKLDCRATQEEAERVVGNRHFAYGLVTALKMNKDQFITTCLLANKDLAHMGFQSTFQCLSGG